MNAQVSRKPFGVLRFPGTNCDRDVFSVLGGDAHNSQEADNTDRVRWVWHADQFNFRDYSALFLPGGFSYGDYLRSGALAARSAAMKSVREAAAAGMPVLGICNGFQILCEAQLLPGVLIRNAGLRFIDDWVDVKLENQNANFGRELKPGHKAKLPIAHADGRFFAEGDDLKKLQDRGQIWWSYLNNPNGSIASIAGVMNESKNVAALMPHPERAIQSWMGGTDGAAFFTNVAG